MEEDRMIDAHWHLKKELNIGHLLTTLMLAIGIIAWGNHMGERMTANEVRIEALQATQGIQLTDTREMRTELLMEVRELRREINQLYHLQERFIQKHNGEGRR